MLAAWMHPCKGKDGTAIEGTGWQTGKIKFMEIIALDWEIMAPRDVSTGLATGRRQHKPFHCTFELDASFPGWLTVLCKNATIEQIQVDTYMARELKAAGGAGKEVLTTKQIYKHCHVSMVQQRSLNNRNPDLKQYEHQFDVAFVYEEVTVDFCNTVQKSFADSWTQQM
jgi:type VI secretion system secreted protein Hcp